MASSSTEDVNEKDQEPKTRLVKCHPEFQKKLDEMYTPMPPPTASSSSKFVINFKYIHSFAFVSLVNKEMNIMS